MPPFQGGGEMIDAVRCEGITYNEPPHRFEAGTPPIVEAIGLGAALDYMMELGRERIRAHEDALSAYAHERLGRDELAAHLRPAPARAPSSSFEMSGAHAHDVATVIDRQGVAVRAGTHCAMPLLERFGVTSTCRASFGLYNTRAEVDKLAEALQKAEACSREDDAVTDAQPPRSLRPNAPTSASARLAAGGDRPADRRHRRGAEDRLRPEIPADIYELGLIYRVDIDDDRNVAIDMTLTAPGCPVAGEMPGWVENAVATVPGVRPSRSTWSSIRPGTKAACPTRRASRSTCGEDDPWRRERAGPCPG